MKYLVSLVMLMMTAYSLAGTSMHSEVTIGSNYASGSLSDARTSSDRFQSIGCVAFAIDNGSSQSGGICMARGADGSTRTVQCYSYEPALAKAMAATNEATHLYFSWDRNGRCTSINTTISSHVVD